MARQSISPLLGRPNVDPLRIQNQLETLMQSNEVEGAGPPREAAGNPVYEGGNSGPNPGGENGRPRLPFDAYYARQQLEASLAKQGQDTMTQQFLTNQLYNRDLAERDLQRGFENAYQRNRDLAGGRGNFFSSAHLGQQSDLAQNYLSNIARLYGGDIQGFTPVGLGNAQNLGQLGLGLNTGARNAGGNQIASQLENALSQIQSRLQEQYANNLQQLRYA